MPLSRWLGHALIWSSGGFPDLEAKGCARSSNRQEYAFLLQTKEQSITVAYTMLLPDRGRAEAWCFQTQDQKQVLQFPCTIRSTYHGNH